MEDGVDAKGVRDEHQDCDEQWEQSKDTVHLEIVAVNSLGEKVVF